MRPDRGPILRDRRALPHSRGAGEVARMMLLHGMEESSMTKTLAFILSASLAACAGQAEVHYSGDVTTPELVAMDNDPSVMVVANADEPTFYADNSYWLYRDNQWYRSSSHRSGWARVDAPPDHVRRIDRPTAYVHFRHNAGAPRTTYNQRAPVAPVERDPRDRDQRDPRDQQAQQPQPDVEVRDHRQPPPAPQLQPRRDAPAPMTPAHEPNPQGPGEPRPNPMPPHQAPPAAGPHDGPDRTPDTVH
jgi:hypothetical protein